MIDFSDIVRTRSSAGDFKRTRDYGGDILQGLDDARHAPSSFNAQPWRFAVVDNRKQLRRLCAAAHEQEKLARAGAAVVFLTHLFPEAIAQTYTCEADASDAAEQIRRSGKIYASRRNAIGDAEVERELRESTCMAAMIFMLSLSSRGVASCPMGGFDAAAVSEELRLPSDLSPVLIVAVGDAPGPCVQRARLPLSDLLYACPSIRNADSTLGRGLFGGTTGWFLPQ